MNVINVTIFPLTLSTPSHFKYPTSYCHIYSVLLIYIPIIYRVVQQLYDSKFRNIFRLFFR